MRRTFELAASACALSVLSISGTAHAQAGAAQADGSALMALDMDALEVEIQQRFDAALAATMDPQIIAANDPRYLWASDAKAQCGIALGYLESSTRDENSIRSCARSSARMMVAPAARAPLPAPAAVQAYTSTVPDAVCAREQVGTVFFDFDAAMPGPDAAQTVDYIVNNAQACGWQGFDIVGHTDRAGSDAYNDALAQRRAEAVAALMRGEGFAPAALDVSARGEEEPRVPTEDGVRNPQNRRVEISIR